MGVVDSGGELAKHLPMAAASRMNPDGPPQIPPILRADTRKKERAPTLYAIIGFKLLKGVVLLIFAFAVFGLRNSNLQEDLSRTLAAANLNPGTGAFQAAADMLRNVSPLTIQLFAGGSFLYGAFSLVEGAGLILRAAWAGWMVIAESAVFVPLELWEAARHFSISATMVLIPNVGIVWYLYGNRRRLFHI
jgi:uncharacterized membrane protein (DUF2068 family)